MRTTAAAAALLLIYTAGIATAQKSVSRLPADRYALHPTAPANSWLNLPSLERQPDRFEPYLQQHPEDEPRRSAAIFWYSNRKPDAKRLREHSLLMIQYHPENHTIYFSNRTAFLADHEYFELILRRLEQSAHQEKTPAGVYWNLASCCEFMAIPRISPEPKRRAAYFNTHHLPANTSVIEHVNHELAQKGIRYYKLAVAAAKRDSNENELKLSTQGLNRLMYYESRSESTAPRPSKPDGPRQAR